MKRSIAVLLIVAAILSVSVSIIGQTKGSTPKPRKAVDPVCGLSVEKLPELSYTYRGETYFFCSKADLKKFSDTPEKYVKKTSSGR